MVLFPTKYWIQYFIFEWLSNRATEVCRKSHKSFRQRHQRDYVETNSNWRYSECENRLWWRVRLKLSCCIDNIFRVFRIFRSISNFCMNIKQTQFSAMNHPYIFLDIHQLPPIFSLSFKEAGWVKSMIKFFRSQSKEIAEAVYGILRLVCAFILPAVVADLFILKQYQWWRS